MRILFLTHRLPYAPNRGDRIRAYHLLQLLAQRHEVHLISLIHDEAELAHLADLKQTVASVAGIRVSRVRNMMAAAYALPGSRPLTHVLLHGARMGVALQRCVSAAAPDLVVAYCTGMARYALESPLRRFPFLLDMVDVDSEKWSALADRANPIKRWIYRREAACLRDFERRVVARARATIVVSERERVLLTSNNPGTSAIVVENGVDVTSFVSPAPPQVEPRVVFCGVFDYGPNEAGAVWMATEVWPLITRRLPAARLSLVGMNPSRAVRALTRDPSVVVTGGVPDVRPYLWESAVAVAPIWIARGVQNKVLEATAAGLPTVVTPPVFEGLPLHVRPACTPAPDARAFADAVLALLNETGDARRRTAARADLSRLTWHEQLAPLLPIVDACAAKARR